MGDRQIVRGVIPFHTAFRPGDIPPEHDELHDGLHGDEHRAAAPIDVTIEYCCQDTSEIAQIAVAADTLHMQWKAASSPIEAPDDYLRITVTFRAV